MEFREEKDSLGKVKVDNTKLYGAQTQRALNNFKISKEIMPPEFIKSLALLKASCAKANLDLKLLEINKAKAIIEVANKINQGNLLEHFPIDVFQTGSATSTNMNMNEVIANYIKEYNNLNVHPNDDVNKGQSSNDIIPTAMNISAVIESIKLINKIDILIEIIDNKAKSLDDVIMMGRTHLMDAMPLKISDFLGGWNSQLIDCKKSINYAIKEVKNLAIGGTAVGSGINTHIEFAKLTINHLNNSLNLDFTETTNHFAAQSAIDGIHILAGCYNNLGAIIMKISNDLRLLNSGPLSGFGEIQLPTLQPGSSIMPAKVNPVIPEACCMVSAEVSGCYTSINIASQSGLFQLNVMFPLVIKNIIYMTQILGNASEHLGKLAIKDFTINNDKIKKIINMNPILVTALNNYIGYNKAAEIGKIALKENKSVLEVAKLETDIPESKLKELLDVKNLV